jgi:hypothetical protein
MSSNGNQIGYGKPPEHSRFTKGQSGNPKGRPKDTKNLATDLREELEERILIREGTRSTRVSKQRAIIKSLMAKTLRGDARAAAALINLMFRVLDLRGGAGVADEVLSPDEREILAALEDELRKEMKADKSGESRNLPEGKS